VEKKMGLLGGIRITFLLGLLFFDVPFFIFNESCGKNCHTPKKMLNAGAGIESKMFIYSTM
jgi:hypothetical protein